MDLGFNKVAFCVLATGLILIGLNEASHSFFPHEEHVDAEGAKVVGYKVDVPEATTGGAAAVEEGPRDYAVLVAAGDIEAGKQVAVKCQQCHTFEGTGALQGPPLYGVIGRPIATVAGFSYSQGENGLAGRAGQVWDYEHFDHFIEAPRKYASGTAMNFVGIKKQKDRSDLMAYLRTLTSGTPLPLPAPLPPQEAAAPADGAAPAPADGAAPGVTPAAATPGAPAPAQPAPAPAPPH